MSRLFPLLLPLLLLLQLSTSAVDARLREAGTAGLLHHHAGHRRPHQRRPALGAWQSGDAWCRAHGRDGLLRVSETVGSEDDAASERLANRAAEWPPGCYWVAEATAPELRDLRWLVDNGRFRGSGCLCLRGGEDPQAAAASPRGARPRLHLTDCGRRLRYVCHHRTRHPGAAAATVAAAPKTSTTTAASVPEIDESVADDSDEAVEHSKFPMMAVGPDGRVAGWLPPWATTATAGEGPPRPLASTMTTSANNSTTAPAGGLGTLRLLMADQRSEFVTLLVLYSIVGVICIVLLVLCILRCCRGYCGRAKVRYVKQVDADDIPRFMPSSWA